VWDRAPGRTDQTTACACHPALRAGTQSSPGLTQRSAGAPWLIFRERFERPDRITKRSGQADMALAPSACQLPDGGRGVALAFAGIILMPLLDAGRIVEIVDHQGRALLGALVRGVARHVHPLHP